MEDKASNLTIRQCSTFTQAGYRKILYRSPPLLYRVVVGMHEITSLSKAKLHGKSPAKVGTQSVEVVPSGVRPPQKQSVGCKITSSLAIGDPVGD